MTPTGNISSPIWIIWNYIYISDYGNWDSLDQENNSSPLQRLIERDFRLNSVEKLLEIDLINELDMFENDEGTNKIISSSI